MKEWSSVSFGYTSTPINAKTMTIQTKGLSLTLDLAKGKVLEETIPS